MGVEAVKSVSVSKNQTVPPDAAMLDVFGTVLPSRGTTRAWLATINATMGFQMFKRLMERRKMTQSVEDRIDAKSGARIEFWSDSEQLAEIIRAGYRSSLSEPLRTFNNTPRPGGGAGPMLGLSNSAMRKGSFLQRVLASSQQVEQQRRQIRDNPFAI